MNRNNEPMDYSRLMRRVNKKVTVNKNQLGFNTVLEFVNSRTDIFRTFQEEHNNQNVKVELVLSDDQRVALLRTAQLNEERERTAQELRQQLNQAVKKADEPDVQPPRRSQEVEQSEPGRVAAAAASP